MFTHARCGGVLIPITAPSWAPKMAIGYGNVGPPDYARCVKCGLPGEVVEVKPGERTQDDIDLDSAATMLRSTLEHLIAHIPKDDPAFIDIPRFDKGSVGRPRTREGAGFPTEQTDP